MQSQIVPQTDNQTDRLPAVRRKLPPNKIVGQARTPSGPQSILPRFVLSHHRASDEAARPQLLLRRLGLGRRSRTGPSNPQFVGKRDRTVDRFSWGKPPNRFVTQKKNSIEKGLQF